jgi:hypothetical protein
MEILGYYSNISDAVTGVAEGWFSKSDAKVAENAAQKAVKNYIHAKDIGNGKTSIEIDSRIVEFWQQYAPAFIAVYVAYQAIIPFVVSATATYLMGAPLHEQFNHLKDVWDRQNLGLQLVSEAAVVAGTFLSPIGAGVVAGAGAGIWANQHYPLHEMKSLIAQYIKA